MRFFEQNVSLKCIKIPIKEASQLILKHKIVEALILNCSNSNLLVMLDGLVDTPF